MFNLIFVHSNDGRAPANVYRYVIGSNTANTAPFDLLLHSEGGRQYLQSRTTSLLCTKQSVMSLDIDHYTSID